MSQPRDAGELAKLRWRLTTDDAEDIDPIERDEFEAANVRFLEQTAADPSLVHWVAEKDRRLVAVNSVRSVAKIHSPRRLDGRWGYVTNV